MQKVQKKNSKMKCFENVQKISFSNNKKVRNFSALYGSLKTKASSAMSAVNERNYARKNVKEESEATTVNPVYSP